MSGAEWIQIGTAACTTGDWVQVQGSCNASAEPARQRQSTISPEAGPVQGKHLSTSQAGRGGLRKPGYPQSRARQCNS